MQCHRCQKEAKDLITKAVSIRLGTYYAGPGICKSCERKIYTRKIRILNGAEDRASTKP